MSRVTLRDHEFDPLDTTDFRLAIEGASKTGKSNTLAVLLEDLAETAVPTLIIERLGILSPVRSIDENLIVVGARNEPGIDLAVPIDQVDIVADLVLERGLKVLLDVSTYSDVGNRHTEHKATATALKALNDRAQARLRSGSRRKCLVVVDEVHYLAPENNAPHIDLDEYVRRCRAQLVKISTEGGNKGLTLITAYQRQAYTSKGIVSQADNYVIHRLHATDRSEVAREIGVGAEEIENLGTGEVLIYGDFTKQRVIGPTRVRKRRSPDPREEQFELPEPPEAISETLASIQGDIEEREEQRREEEERITELERQNERLREQLEDLKEQADVSERIARALESIQEGGVDAAAEAELAEEFEELREQRDRLQERLDEREGEFEAMRDELDAREERIEELETELADYRELDVVREEILSAANTIRRQLGAVDPDVEEAEEQLADLREENQELRERVETLQSDIERARSEGVSLGEQFDSAMDFIRHEAVQSEIRRAISQTGISESHGFDIVLTLADDSPLTNEELASRVDVGYSTVKKLTGKLHEHNILARERDGQTYLYELAVDGLEEIVRQREKRDQVVRLREELTDS